MRSVYSYARLLIATTLFVAGIALQFYPSAATVARDARWRERQLRAVPADQREQWIYDRDLEDARSEGYVRVFGVLLGALGLGGALVEAVYLRTAYAQRAADEGE
jgi:hypothetical protein